MYIHTRTDILTHLKLLAKKKPNIFTYFIYNQIHMYIKSLMLNTFQLNQVLKDVFKAFTDLLKIEFNCQEKKTDLSKITENRRKRLA